MVDWNRSGLGSGVMPPASGSLPSGPYPLSLVPMMLRVTPELICMLWFAGLVWPIQSVWMVVFAEMILSIVASGTAPGLKNRASSLAPGGPAGVQLPEMLQSPPLGPDHVFVAARAHGRRVAVASTMREA